MNKILFSIIIPAFNVAEYIEKAIDSILNQSFSSYEIIIYNDASTDGTLNKLQGYKHLESVTIINNYENLGLAHARNASLAKAIGEYVIFLDGDDYLSDMSLEYLSKSIGGNDLLIYDHLCIWENGEVRPSSAKGLLHTNRRRFQTVQDRLALFDVLNVAWNKVYRRSFLTHNNLFFEDGYYEDIPFHYKVILCATRLSVVPKVCYYYRQREGAILNSTSDKHSGIIIQYKRIFDYIETNKTQTCVRDKIMGKLVSHIFILFLKNNKRLKRQSVVDIYKGFIKLFCCYGGNAKRNFPTCIRIFSIHILFLCLLMKKYDSFKTRQPKDKI